MKQIGRFIELLFVLNLFTISTGCNHNLLIPMDNIPNLGIPIDQFNIIINTKTVSPSNSKYFKFGETIYLDIHPLSDETIAFDTDFGHQIFRFEDDQWIEIDNLMIYPPIQGYFYLSPDSKDPFSKIARSAVSPNIQNSTEAMIIRIFTIGYIYRDGKVTNEKTGAWVDVNLVP